MKKFKSILSFFSAILCLLCAILGVVYLVKFNSSGETKDGLTAILFVIFYYGNNITRKLNNIF